MCNTLLPCHPKLFVKTLSFRPKLRLPKEGEAKWRNLLFVCGATSRMKRTLLSATFGARSLSAAAQLGTSRPPSQTCQQAIQAIHSPHMTSNLASPQKLAHDCPMQRPHCSRNKVAYATSVTPLISFIHNILRTNSLDSGFYSGLARTG
jgi:hypothetical protein